MSLNIPRGPKLPTLPLPHVPGVGSLGADDQDKGVSSVPLSWVSGLWEEEGICVATRPRLSMGTSWGVATRTSNSVATTHPRAHAVPSRRCRC